jgi:hypothetical protein
MATTSEARALPFFTDTLGQPLESGSIYIGQPGLDPMAYPASVFSDVAETIVLAQPIRTVHGHAVSAGAQVHLFCSIPYSILILDAAGRTVYAALNEIDPIFTALSKSTVQSASGLPALRALSGPSTNMVWVAGFGMYLYIPNDTTSPEQVPFVIVGTDGSRYYLDLHTGNLSLAKISGNAFSPNAQGLWLSWNDEGNGATRITNNQGSSSGGVIIRNVNSDNTVETGRVTINPNGSITTTGITSTGNITSSNNLIAGGGIVAVTADGSKSLQWDGSKYVLANANLSVNGSLAVTSATLLSNQLANGVGALALGTNTAPAPAQPGTWAQTGTASNSVFLWVRTA